MVKVRLVLLVLVAEAVNVTSSPTYTLFGLTVKLRMLAVMVLQRSSSSEGEGTEFNPRRVPAANPASRIIEARRLAILNPFLPLV